MIVKLKRLIKLYEDEDDEIEETYTIENTVRIDRIDSFWIEHGQLAIVIGGSEFFYNFEKDTYNKIKSYFENLDKPMYSNGFLN